MNNNDEECLDAMCSIHNRIDYRHVSHDVEYARIITYVGEWCVITDDNPAAVNEVPLDKSPMTVEEFAEHIANLPHIDLYETNVVKVGSGSLGDLDSIDGSFDEFTYYRESHDNWPDVEDTHEIIVNHVWAGQLDLSRSLMDQEIDAMLEWK